jgi:phosphoribosylaminoimidazole carboxylase PurE protein
MKLAVEFGLTGFTIEKTLQRGRCRAGNGEHTMKKNDKGVVSVAVIMGSDSDWEVMAETVKMLENFGVNCDTLVMSAHRTPDRAADFSKTAAQKGIKVIIAAAGSAAHLAGVVAAHTTLPVIGVPMKGGALDGLDALLSTVQMPAGIPVATVALGKAGAVNAAILAVQMLALARPDLQKKLAKHRQGLKKKVDEGNARVRAAREGKGS